MYVTVMQAHQEITNTDMLLHQVIALKAKVDLNVNAMDIFAINIAH